MSDTAGEQRRRKPPRAVRFADIKIGDQLVKRSVHKWTTLLPGAANWSERSREEVEHHIVTDLWFDPVAGQKNPCAGEMVGIAMIRQDGSIWGRKYAHSKLGLASQGFKYDKTDYIALCRARMECENVVGIQYGKTIRKRPKMSVPGL